MDATGVVRPVIGADVRWEIDQWWAARINSMQFGTSDDNRVALGYGVFDDQADTRTNSASLDAERFPLIASEYPLYNGTGVGTPFVDGLTWVTLFSPDREASGRIVLVATVDGEEVGKQILFKSFAPAPELVITKNVDQAVVNLSGGQATVTWTVTITNVGTGDAVNVSLADFLASGNGAAYTAAAFPGTANTGDGFDYTFDLPAAPVPTTPAYPLGRAKSFAVLAKSTVTNTPTSVISGDVGVSAGTAVTGLLPADVLNGTIHNNDAAAQAAQTSLTAAYTSLSQRACTGAPNTPLSDGNLGPGVYCYSSEIGLTGPLILDAGGDPNAEFVFKINSALNVAGGASVSLVNGANPCNVYWLIGSSATIGTNAFFAGNILATESITSNTGATVSGRLLASTGAVTIDSNSINAPLTCAAVPPPTADNVLSFTFTGTVTEAGTWCNEAQILGFDSATATFTPVDLNAQACFTALESNLSIIKDFVADDNSTSLGKDITVAANVPAKLRVRVVNSGTGAATAVAVNDALTTGLGADYTLLSLSAGTISGDGFDTTIGDLAAGETATFFFTASASVDGRYCDTVTLTAAAGTNIGIGTDSACFTVATPNLEITKDDAPASVIPSGSYTSTIVVTNTGAATARNVVVRDLLGSLSPAGTPFVIYVSSSQDGAGGILGGNVVTAPNTVDIPADGSMTFLVVSRIPPGAVSGDYCDTATVTSSNAPTKDASACVHVPAFSALQTQLIDLNDPVAVGSNVTYSAVMYVEALSNEGVGQNVLTYSFGLDSPAGLGTAGRFQVVSTAIYLDTAPVRDPVTGAVVSDSSSATAVLQHEGTDYTLNTVLGKQVVTMTAGVVLAPNTALYMVHVVSVPTGTPTNHLYTTSYIWDSVGLVDPNHHYQASSSEPTTVLP